MKKSAASCSNKWTKGWDGRCTSTGHRPRMSVRGLGSWACVVLLKWEGLRSHAMKLTLVILNILFVDR